MRYAATDAKASLDVHSKLASLPDISEQVAADFNRNKGSLSDADGSRPGMSPVDAFVATLQSTQNVKAATRNAKAASEAPAETCSCMPGHCGCAASNLTDAPDTEEPDGKAAAILHALLSVKDEPPDVQQRVLLDAFHALQRISKNASHTNVYLGLVMAALRDALFVNNDFEDLEKNLEARGMSKGEIRKLKKSYFVKRGPRHCPRPADMQTAFLRVVEWLKSFAEDNELGNVIGTVKVAKELQKLLGHIRNGCLSDPQDLVMYFKTPKGKLLSKRGSSALEGWHKHLRRLVNGARLCPQMLDCLILDFVHRWNVKAGIRNCGEHDFGHYDHWAVEELKSVVIIKNKDDVRFKKYFRLLNRHDAEWVLDRYEEKVPGLGEILRSPDEPSDQQFVDHAAIPGLRSYVASPGDTVETFGIAKAMENDPCFGQVAEFGECLCYYSLVAIIGVSLDLFVVSSGQPCRTAQ